VTSTHGTPLRTLAFGDLDAGTWGVAWGEAEPQLAVGATHDGAVIAGAPASISGSSAGEEWIVTAPGIELIVSPETAPGRPLRSPGSISCAAFTAQS